MLFLFTAITSFGLLFDLPREMWDDHKYILWRRIKCSTLNKKSGASFHGCLFLCRWGLRFFFNKMRSFFVEKPNLTAVKMYEVWLLVRRVLQSSEVWFIAIIWADPKLLFTRLVLYVRGTEELFSKQLVCESFLLVICFLVFFFQGYNSDGKRSKKIIFQWSYQF